MNARMKAKKFRLCIVETVSYVGVLAFAYGMLVIAHGFVNSNPLI